MIDKLVLALVVIGALNWGSIGLFQFDFVAAVFGGQAAIFSRIGLHAGCVGWGLGHFLFLP